MKFIKLTKFYSDKNAAIYVNMARVESIVDKIEDDKVVGSIIWTASSRSDDEGIMVKETFGEIMSLLYWEDIDGFQES